MNEAQRRQGIKRCQGVANPRELPHVFVAFAVWQQQEDCHGANRSAARAGALGDGRNQRRVRVRVGVREASSHSTQLKIKLGANEQPSAAAPAAAAAVCGRGRGRGRVQCNE